MKFFQLVSSILIAQGAGLLGSLFTFKSVRTWYTVLEKPALNPPSWVFGPVWTTLYLLMGISAYLIWQKRGSEGAKLALWIYGVQLVLNALWSVLFFGLHNPALAFFEIIILLIFIIITTVLFWRISPIAGALLIPYILWVSFASYLNFSLWQLN